MKNNSRLDKAELIKSLAEKMDLVDKYDTTITGSKYDASTGTLYCEGLTFPHSSLESIKNWYKTQMNVYKTEAARDSSKMEYFMRFAVAYNAIQMLEDNVGEMQHKHSNRS